MKEFYLDHFLTKWIEPKNILTPKDALKKKLPEEFPLMQSNCDLTTHEIYENIPKSICPCSSDEDDKGKDETKAKQVKLAQKTRKPQAAKNGPKKAHPCDKSEASFVCPFQDNN